MRKNYYCTYLSFWIFLETSAIRINSMNSELITPLSDCQNSQQSFEYAAIISIGTSFYLAFDWNPSKWSYKILSLDSGRAIHLLNKKPAQTVLFRTYLERSYHWLYIKERLLRYTIIYNNSVYRAIFVLFPVYCSIIKFYHWEIYFQNAWSMNLFGADSVSTVDLSKK